MRLGIDFGTDAGSLCSFEAIYDAYYDLVARWIRALAGSTADRDDLVQEVFLVVYRRLADFDGRNLKGWLYRITVHQVRDYQRLVWIRHIFGRRAEVPKSERGGSTDFGVGVLQRLAQGRHHILIPGSDGTEGGADRPPRHRYRFW